MSVRKSRAFAIFSWNTVYAVIFADSPEEAAKTFGGDLVSRLDEKPKQSELGLYIGTIFLPAHIFREVNPRDDGEGYEVCDEYQHFCQDKFTGIKASNYDFQKNYGLLAIMKEVPIFRKTKKHS